MAIRSGRFSSNDASGNNKILVIKGKRSGTFRFFNSGGNPFTILPSGENTPSGKQIVLNPTFSVDISPGNGGVYIVGEPPIGMPPEDQPIEGIYDFLSHAATVRSGRFNIKLRDHLGAAVDPTTPHQIIDLQGGNSNAWYRIFNSGDFNIEIEKGKQNPVVIKLLAPGQSFDFQVSQKNVYVKSTNAKEPIEGIYEFLA